MEATVTIYSVRSPKKRRRQKRVNTSAGIVVWRGVLAWADPSVCATEAVN